MTFRPSSSRRTILSTLAALALAASLGAGLVPGSARAESAVTDLSQPLPAPTGDVLLTVSGEVGRGNAKDSAGKTVAKFDREMLAALPAAKIETTTLWTEGKQTFVGVPMQDLLAAVKATGTSLSATAINDYAVAIPVEDWSKGGPVLAYERNGAPMSLREKGPLWVIYPFDSGAEFRTEVIYSRSIWQLDRIVVGR